MLSLCLFSKNRPMQLDCCLKSLKNAPYITDVNVLYTYDSPFYESGYNTLIKDYPDVNFILEPERQHWRELIISLVESFNEYFLWGTDDSIFFLRKELTQEKMDWAFKEQNAISLNLRVGLNIVWQNHWHSQKTPPIPVKDRFEDLVSWDSSNIDVQNDVGRLWQNDASIMPRDLYLERLLAEDHWYKGLGCRGLDNVAQSGNFFNPRVGTCFDHSVYVNVPVNLVHLLDNGRLYADNWGKSNILFQDIHNLNLLFLQGFRIDLDKIDIQDLDCGRIEIDYPYYKRQL